MSWSLMDYRFTHIHNTFGFITPLFAIKVQVLSEHLCDMLFFFT